MADLQLGPFPGGIDNRQPANSLAPGYCRDAVNVVVDAAGRFSTRRGHNKAVSVYHAANIFACPLGKFVVQQGTLYRENTTLTPLKTGLSGNCAFEYAFNKVFLSDDFSTWQINPDLTVTSWGVSTAPMPTLAAIGGALEPGTYLVQVAHLNSDGQEGGISLPATITLSSTGGIRVLLDGASRVYVSWANGSHAYYAGTAVAALDVIQPPAGQPAPVRFVTPPPPGSIIRFFAGRLYVVSGSVVWWSEGYKPHRFHVAKDFRSFNDPVTLLEPVSDGLWIATTQETWWLGGKDPDTASWTQQLNYGAMAGGGWKVPNDNDVVWASPRGLIRGAEGGQLKNLTEDHVAIDPGDTAATCIIETNGQRIGIFSYIPTGQSPFINSEWRARQ